MTVKADLIKSDLDKLKERCSKYIDDPKYVYKKCRDSRSLRQLMKWIVVLEKIDGTRTNEDRKDVVNANYAKFRCSKLKVVEIIDINNFEKTKQYIIHSFDGVDMLYHVGYIARPNGYDREIDVVCSNGIHYFKTIDCAYFYSCVPATYTGPLRIWDDNGRTLCDGNVVDGKSNGSWTFWHKNGEKQSEGKTKNGNKTGKWINWHDDKNKESEGYFLNGNKEGLWTYYWNTSEVRIECDYSKDMPNGACIFYHKNGLIANKGTFKNNILVGTWTEYREDGKIHVEREYDNNKVKKAIIWNNEGIYTTEYY